MDKNDRRYGQTADEFILRDLRQMEQAPAYHDWVYSLVQPHLGNRILEIGSGIGSFTRRMLTNADLVVGIEPNNYCASVLQENVTDEHFIFHNKRIEEVDTAELRQHALNTIICVNVLEHIEHDREVIEKFLTCSTRMAWWCSFCPP
ncbi:MAG: methyltransferase domain-containing protein [Chloroflexi bacterium]|nr:methyltransferase domain-containing protein [Chloroflexota bacterium]